MKKIISILTICFLIGTVACKPKKTKSRFAKGPITKQTIIADVKSKLGEDYKVMKVTINKKYEKNNKIKAKVHLKAKNASGAKEAYKFVYKQKDGQWTLSNAFKLDGKEWKLIGGDKKDSKNKKGTKDKDDDSDDDSTDKKGTDANKQFRNKKFYYDL